MGPGLTPPRPEGRGFPLILLKLILIQAGLERLTEMAGSGRIELSDGPFRTWFTATDLEDLDLDPDGRPVSREVALDRLNDHLSGQIDVKMEP